jgi:hypothetical protein
MASRTRDVPMNRGAVLVNNRVVEADTDRLAIPSATNRALVRERFRNVTAAPPNPPGFGPRKLPPSETGSARRRRRQMERGILKPSED